MKKTTTFKQVPNQFAPSRIRDDLYFHRYACINHSECVQYFFFYSPPFYQPSHKEIMRGEALSPFPYSLALVHCPAPLPSSLHLVTPTGEAESQRTCLFINVADGSRQRRKERAVRREAENETRAREGKRAREKQGGKCEGEQLEYFHSAAKLMNNTLVKCAKRAAG